ncbi:MAG: ABC-type transport auxiliary lipoprotein family protein [Beijerinckiaceae bacterium]|nr:ABC-type transport auxiliary lipoprotein family protein [Beijerinckiaceae bacterium]MCI0600888.1 ABC-type transport auxiliary lipoprotein family protein [Beijerinckiaceae bacterium]
MRCFGANRTSFILHVRQGRSLFWVMLAGAFVLLLGACSSDPKLTYDLSPGASGLTARGGRGQLAIALPDATLPANSDGIVVRTGSQSVAYLTGAQWADKLPSLVQSRLIESFQNAHLLRSVGRPGILADATLQTTLRRFELDAAQSEAAVEISAQLIGSSGRIIAGRLFAASVPAPSSEPSMVAAALEAALRQVMREIVVWAAPKI